MSDFASAAFRTESFRFTADDTGYVCRHVSAAVWLEWLGSGAWYSRVFSEGLTTTSYGRLQDLAAEDRMPKDHVPHVARAALAGAAGRPWWEAERLASVSLDPGFLGHLLLSGADPSRLSLAAWFALVYAAVIRGQDQMGRMRFEAEISMPPPEAADEWEEEDVSVTLARMRTVAGVQVG